MEILMRWGWLLLVFLGLLIFLDLTYQSVNDHSLYFDESVLEPAWPESREQL